MRVLLVSPGFHGYWRSIADALETRGHEVAPHIYDDLGGFRAKVGNKLLHELPERMGLSGSARLERDLTAAAVGAVRRHKPDVVVVVKGDLLGDAFWETLDQQRLPRVLWLYDELRRLSFSDVRLARVGPIASYSPVDVRELQRRGVPATHLPLAFDPRFPQSPAQPGATKVVFVGARYPQREETLSLLLRERVDVRAFGRQWSHHPVDRIRTWDPRRPEIPAGRDLPREAAYLQMGQAAATLNIHGDQDGFTMRTFEACGVGAVQLIDRTDLDGLYEPGRELATYSSPEELVDLCRRAVRDPTWAASLREQGRARTLAHHTFAARVAVLESLWQG